MNEKSRRLVRIAKLIIKHSTKPIKVECRSLHTDSWGIGWCPVIDPTWRLNAYDYREVAEVKETREERLARIGNLIVRFYSSTSPPFKVERRALYAEIWDLVVDSNCMWQLESFDYREVEVSQEESQETDQSPTTVDHRWIGFEPNSLT